MTIVTDFIKKLINATDRNTLKWSRIPESSNKCLQTYFDDHKVSGNDTIAALLNRKREVVQKEDSFQVQYQNS